MLVTSAVVVYLPLATGVLFGLLLGGETTDGDARSATELFVHNLGFGAITVIGGVLTLGAFAVATSCYGGFVNGYGMGVVLGEEGVVELAVGLPHFLPETVASVLFVAVAISPTARVLWRRVLDRTVDPLREAIRRWLMLTVVGVGLLVIAALLEASTG